MFATQITSPKGKIIKRYKNKDVKTPLACLVRLLEQDLITLKKGSTLQALLAQASAQTDLAAAQAMQRAKSELFASFVRPKRLPTVIVASSASFLDSTMVISPIRRRKAFWSRA